MVRFTRTVATRFTFVSWLQICFYGALILYFGKTIFIPVSFALLISFVLFPVCKWIEGKGVGKLSSIVLALTLLFALTLLLAALFISQISAFLKELPLLQAKVRDSYYEFSNFLTMRMGLSIERQEEFMKELYDQIGGNLLVFAEELITASITSLILFILIPVYAVLILYYRIYWMELLHRLFPTERRSELRSIVNQTIHAYYNFIKGMALVYLIVGILNSVGLLILGIPHAFLFGFVASILTFIPYVGILAGSLLPMAIAWITYDSIWYPVGVIGIFAFVQYLEANVIFPFAVSHRLNVNTFIMLVAIFVGGLLWGVSGMILFVPFVGIAKLIADHNPAWQTLSMILGTKRKT
jgi:predicted PurR-regulated permease PerM